ncbi:MAG: S1 RNA-binding domain-containing protein [Oscillospiraceae bacterium]|nr:S1 RNA-binding domain-containing protein [Oscillospiraceae bacterium]
MEFTVGALLEGKVKSITKFGAFITLPENRTGMVHISEVANTYVSDIHDHLTEGQDVKVKVIGIDPAGKISLSIKRTQEPERRERRPQQDRRPPRQDSAPKGPQTFEEKLKQFMSDSDSRIAGCRQYEHKTKSRRR